MVSGNYYGKTKYVNERYSDLCFDGYHYVGAYDFVMSNDKGLHDLTTIARRIAIDESFDHYCKMHEWQRGTVYGNF